MQVQCKKNIRTFFFLKRCVFTVFRGSARALMHIHKVTSASPRHCVPRLEGYTERQSLMFLKCVSEKKCCNVHVSAFGFEAESNASSFTLKLPLIRRKVYTLSLVSLFEGKNFKRAVSNASLSSNASSRAVKATSRD